MDLEFAAPVIEWRGPAPFYFARVPEEECAVIDDVKAAIAYWGVVPVTVELGETTFATSMFPREGGWLVPLKDAVRRAEEVGLGDVVELRLVLDV